MKIILNARPSHKLLALEVRARQDPALTDQYVADAVERFGNAARLAQTYQGGADLADETLLALATFLNKIGRPAKTLEVSAGGTRDPTGGPLPSIRERARRSATLE